MIKNILQNIPYILVDASHILFLSAMQKILFHICKFIAIKHTYNNESIFFLRLINYLSFLIIFLRALKNIATNCKLQVRISDFSVTYE